MVSLWRIAALPLLLILTSTVQQTVSSDSCKSPDCPDSVTMAEVTTKPKVTELLQQDSEQIIEFLGGIYEHSSWVAKTLVTKELGSITTVSELANLMKTIVEDASQEQKLQLLKAHPDLGAKVAKLKTLTKESQEEQGKAGLQSMEGAELDHFNTLNQNYAEKFQFPFILAVRNASKHTVISALEGRLPNPSQVEFATALSQVHKIAWMRLLSKLDTDDATGFLTCHVLDTANGCPAAHMRVVLTRIVSPTETQVIGEFVTNDDGRLEGGPALKGGKEFKVGVYEWTFYAGDYFARKGTFISGTPFLDVIPIRFGIDNPDDHYHVPLLVSPWSFSTYRGS